MPLSDMVVDNGTGIEVRGFINEGLGALVSNSSGSVDPITVGSFPYQWWADTGSMTLKLRNAANDGWFTVMDLTAENLLSGPGAAVTDERIAVFDGASGELVKDGGQTIAEILAAAGDVTGPGTSAVDNIAVFNSGDGKVIKDGGQTIAEIILAAGGGTTGLELIGTVSANNDADITVTGLGGFDSYYVSLSGLRPTITGVFAHLRVGDSGGINTGAADYGGTIVTTDSVNIDHFPEKFTNASFITMMDNSSGGDLISGTDGGFGGYFHMQSSPGGGTGINIVGQMIGELISGDSKSTTLSGQRKASINLDRVQFFFSSGLISVGSMTVYGFKV